MPSLPLTQSQLKKGGHLDELLAAGMSGRLVQLLWAHLDYVEVLTPGMRLLADLCSHMRAQTLVGMQGGVQVCLAVLAKHCAYKILVEKTLRALTLMSGEDDALNPPNCIVFAAEDGMRKLLPVLTKWHQSSPSVVASCATLAYRACEAAADDDIALALRIEAVKSGVAGLVVKGMLSGEQNRPLLRAGLRLLVACVQVPANRQTLVRLGAVQASTALLKVSMTNAKSVLSVLGFVGTVCHDYERDDTPFIVRDEPHVALQSIPRSYRNNSRVLTLTFACLATLGARPRLARMIGDASFLEKIVGETVNFGNAAISDAERFMPSMTTMVAILHLLTTLSRQAGVAARLTTHARALMSVGTALSESKQPHLATAEARSRVKEVHLSLISCLTAVVSHQNLSSGLRVVEAAADDWCGKLLYLYMDGHSELSCAALRLLTLLACDEQTTDVLCARLKALLVYVYTSNTTPSTTPTSAAPVTSTAVVTSTSAAAVATAVYLLLSNLALFENPCLALLRGDWAQLAFESMLSLRYRRHPAVIVRIFTYLLTSLFCQDRRAKPLLKKLNQVGAITLASVNCYSPGLFVYQTFTCYSSSDTDVPVLSNPHLIPSFLALLFCLPYQGGGIEAAIEAHASDPEVQKVGDELLTALYGRRQRRVHITQDMVRNFKAWVEEMMPQRQRNLMQTGVLCNVYEPGRGAKKRKLYMSDDWLAVAWMNPKAMRKELKTTKHKGIRHWQLVLPGATTPELMKANVDPEGCMSLIDHRGEGNQLGFDVLDKKTCTSWVAGGQRECSCDVRFLFSSALCVRKSDSQSICNVRFYSVHVRVPAVPAVQDGPCAHGHHAQHAGRARRESVRRC
jgi:hypothetical protein